MNALSTFFCRLLGFLARCAVVVLSVVSGTFFAGALVLLLIGVGIGILAMMLYNCA